MTTPPFQPVDPEPGTATEPVPQAPGMAPVPQAPGMVPIRGAAPAPSAAPAPGTAPAWGSVPAAPPRAGAAPAGPQWGAPVAPPPSFAPVTPEPGYSASGPVGAPARPASGSSRLLTVALAGAVLIAAVGVAFALGRSSAPASPSAAVTQQGDQGFGGNGGNGVNRGGLGSGSGPLNGAQGPNASFDLNGNGGGPGGPGDIDGGLGLERGFGRGFGAAGISGTVKSVSGDSVTITLANGQTVTFKVDSSTTYHQQVPATASDVKQGATVQVKLGGRFQPGQITQNADGSITLGTAGDVTVVP